MKKIILILLALSLLILAGCSSNLDDEGVICFDSEALDTLCDETEETEETTIEESEDSGLEYVASRSAAVMKTRTPDESKAACDAKCGVGKNCYISSRGEITCF